ncbi:MAG: serine/threonine-protein phosphatase [Bryobacterales bacterium]|nr:serine/threonine-protein phosphatase [Bryobacterales bacterium]
MNRAIGGSMRGGFVTCVAARFAADGSGWIANAGHLMPYCDGQELAVESGLPLGVMRDAAYGEERVGPGAYVFVSDGVVEAANASGELFGFARTAALSRSGAKEIARAAEQWGQNDDITVVTVRRGAACQPIESAAAGSAT